MIMRPSGLESFLKKYILRVEAREVAEVNENNEKSLLRFSKSSRFLNLII
jgi:hypothetical protein